MREDSDDLYIGKIEYENFELKNENAKLRAALEKANDIIDGLEALSEPTVASWKEVKRQLALNAKHIIDALAKEQKP